MQVQLMLNLNFPGKTSDAGKSQYLNLRSPQLMCFICRAITEGFSLDLSVACEFFRGL